MGNDKSNNLYDFTKSFKTKNFILNEDSFLSKLSLLKTSSDKIKFLNEVRIRVKLCIFEIESNRKDLVYNYLFKNTLDPHMNEDIYDHIKYLYESYATANDERIEFLKSNYIPPDSKDSIKFLRRYSFISDDERIVYTILDIPKNRRIISHINLNIDAFLNSLKNRLLPRIELEIEKTNIEIKNYDNEGIGSNNIDNEQIEWQEDDVLKINFKDETKNFFNETTRSKEIDINDKYFVSKAKKKLVSILNQKNNKKLSVKNLESIRTYLTKLKQEYLNSTKTKKRKK